MILQMLLLTFLSSGSPSLAADLTGTITVDGSSTVYPITEAMAEEFGKANKKVRVAVGVSGTGGGLKKFGAGDIDIADASRPIKDKEAADAKAKQIDFVELPVAYDGIAVVVNKSNPVETITFTELKTLWANGSTAKKWKDVNGAWADQNLKLYSPGADSGTFEYFKETILGKDAAIRSDFTASEDDNVLITGVAGDKGGFGYFGYSYYEENKTKLKALKVDGGKGAVEPNRETIESGKYPLSRPVFIYVSSKAAQRPEVQAFVEFYLDNAATLVPQVGMVPLPAAIYAAAKKRFKEKTYGSVYTSEDKHHQSLSQLYNVVN
jgi:phosphate transport system substrate-binding protein